MQIGESDQGPINYLIHERDLEIGIALKDTEMIGPAQDRSQDSVVSQDKNPTQDSLISETGTEGQEIIDQDQDQDPHPNQEVTLPGQDRMKTKEDT